MADVKPLIVDGNKKRQFNPTTDTVVGLSSFSKRYFSVSDRKNQGVDGGTFNAGAWRTRDLNTVHVNDIPGAALSANQITLLAGTYFVIWRAPAFEAGAQIRYHQTRWYNVTDAATILNGSTASTSRGIATDSVGYAQFTIAATKVFQLQHIIDTTINTFGFGDAGNLAQECYSHVNIWRLN